MFVAGIRLSRANDELTTLWPWRKRRESRPRTVTLASGQCHEDSSVGSKLAVGKSGTSPARARMISSAETLITRRVESMYRASGHRRLPASHRRFPVQVLLAVRALARTGARS